MLPLNIPLLLKEDDLIFVAFDSGKKTFRSELLDSYKAQRKPIEEDLAVQLPVAREYLKAMNIVYYEKEGLLKPSYINQDNGYRYYETSELIQVSKIIALRQIGLSIKDIKSILEGQDIKEKLTTRKKELEENNRARSAKLRIIERIG